jgi:2-hydroxy-3-keto-5-methylthiopentenyl-1-phosphate phosphatase
MPAEPVLVQSDFDGTLTVGDISFDILDEFTGSVWRKEFDDYMQGKITVNRFNTRAFSRVKATRSELELFVHENAVIRPGINELVSICKRKDFRFFIVSNGMAFYIEIVLEMAGLKNVEFVAGLAEFSTQGMKTWYPGPDGKAMEDGFKEAWTEHFLAQGYRVVYIGNGASDFAPARRCSHVFAIDNLKSECQKAGVSHTTFNDLHDVAKALRTLK